MPDFGFWDIALIAGVSLQATVMAYLYRPRWKALLYSLPIPFSLASMSLGQPVGVTHVTGLLLLLAFFHLVRFLHQEATWPIVACIVLGAVTYLSVATVLASSLPRAPGSFWVACSLALGLGLYLFKTVPHRPEPGHRSPLPVYVKLPVVAGVIVGLVLMKRFLEGFMAMFPMMGVITAYEARHSLWTITRQVPVVILTFVPMVAVCRLLQGHVGLGAAIAAGWVVHLSVLTLLTRQMWGEMDGEEGE